MTYKEIQESLKALYPVNSVSRGFRYWARVLTEKCYGMFDYKGLPDSLPAEQIEQRLILTGFCGVFKDNKHGLVTSYGGMSGQDIYYLPVNFTYTQPVLGSGTLKIGTECVIIYHSQIDVSQNRIGMSDLIKRYARQLADIESSINISIVNARNMYLAVAKNQNVAKTVNEVFNKMRMGEFETINEQTILDCFHTFPFNDGKASVITELLKARKDTISAFLEEIGIQSAKEKKERLITDEVTSNQQLLLVNQEDMLNSRQKGIASINKLFDTNITVDISSEYKPKNDMERGIENDNT